MGANEAIKAYEEVVLDAENYEAWFRWAMLLYAGCQTKLGGQKAPK